MSKQFTDEKYLPGKRVRINQIELINAILKELDRQYKGIAPYCLQYNEIIKAANLVVDVMGRDFVPATPGMGLDAWIKSDDTGASSLYMASRMFGRPLICEHAYPHDPDDFGRCYRFLEAVPEARKNLGRITSKVFVAFAPVSGSPSGGPVWAALLDNWDELERLYLEERPRGTCPRLYARMQELIASAKAAEPSEGGGEA